MKTHLGVHMCMYVCICQPFYGSSDIYDLYHDTDVKFTDKRKS